MDCTELRRGRPEGVERWYVIELRDAAFSLFSSNSYLKTLEQKALHPMMSWKSIIILIYCLAIVFFFI